MGIYGLNGTLVISFCSGCLTSLLEEIIDPEKQCSDQKNLKKSYAPSPRVPKTASESKAPEEHSSNDAAHNAACKTPHETALRLLVGLRRGLRGGGLLC